MDTNNRESNLPVGAIWSCKIGCMGIINLPSGADWPMRLAVSKAYYDITGKYPDFIFSGWSGVLTSSEEEFLKLHNENRP